MIYKIIRYFICFLFITVNAYAVDIVFIGDSNTLGNTDPNNYPYHVCDTLSCGTYWNAGVGGQGTTGVAARFETDAIDRSPNFIVIMTGTNDAYSTESYISDYTNMLDACVTAGITPIVLSILPRTYTADGGTINLSYDAKNTALYSLLASYPIAIWVDNRSTIGEFRDGGAVGNLWDIKAEYDNGDGTHINGSGCAALAELVVNAILNSGYKKHIISSDAPIMGINSNAPLSTISGN